MLREHPAAKTYNSMIKNYEELGFRSQKELEESIERVKAAKKNPKNDLELRAENKARFDAMIEDGGIDLKGIQVKTISNYTEDRGNNPLPLLVPELHAVTVHFFSRKLFRNRTNQLYF